MGIMFRELYADEIEVRAAQCTEDGVQFLLYKDARCDMNILDETVGPMNWQRHHSRENANCTVSIWDSEKGQWISKEDTGTESNTEKEKGLASSSFKRACTNFGIGRSLYTSPYIFVKAKCEKKSGSGQFTKYAPPKHLKNVSVSVYECENGKIVNLELIDSYGNVIFSWKKTQKKKTPPKVDYSLMSTGSAAAPAPTPVKTSEKNNKCPQVSDDSAMILPNVFNTEDESSLLLPFGTGKELKEEKKEEPENAAFLANAELAESKKNGAKYVRLTYSYEYKAGDEKQVIVLNNKYAVKELINTLKALDVIPADVLDGVSHGKKEDLEKAIKLLNKEKRKKLYMVDVTKNSKGYDVFSIKVIE